MIAVTYAMGLVFLSFLTGYFLGTYNLNRKAKAIADMAYWMGVDDTLCGIRQLEEMEKDEAI